MLRNKRVVEGVQVQRWVGQRLLLLLLLLLSCHHLLQLLLVLGKKLLLLMVRERTSVCVGRRKGRRGGHQGRTTSEIRGRCSRRGRRCERTDAGTNRSTGKRGKARWGMMTGGRVKECEPAEFKITTLPSHPRTDTWMRSTIPWPSRSTTTMAFDNVMTAQFLSL